MDIQKPLEMINWITLAETILYNTEAVLSFQMKPTSERVCITADSTETMVTYLIAKHHQYGKKTHCAAVHLTSTLLPWTTNKCSLTNQISISVEQSNEQRHCYIDQFKTNKHWVCISWMMTGCKCLLCVSLYYCHLGVTWWASEGPVVGDREHKCIKEKPN